ncbi:MAG: DUF1428 domain-containing protein [Nanoarchaeota archaeon]
MKYVDGFVIAIPKKNLKTYKKMAELGAKIWKKHGALEYYECIGDDLNPKGDPNMQPAKFTELAKTKSNETVIFSFIVYKSKTHRDKVNAAVMKDPAMSPEKMKDMPMPFKMNRMAYGGFSAFVER